MDTITTRLVDIHNHTLPFVDDGSKSYEDALDNLRFLKSIGTTDVVLTSHYIENSKYVKNVQERETILEHLKEQSREIGINLYLGNEIYISDEDTLKDLLKRKEITTLNNSRYMLIEFPLWQKLNNVERVLCALNEAGIVPIIAHPERYTYIQKNFDKIYDLLEYDCLLQCNISSYTGYYGTQAKKTIKRLLKENLVSFLATDLHHVPTSNKLLKALNLLQKKLPNGQFNELTVSNPMAVINNERVKNPTGY